MNEYESYEIVKYDEDTFGNLNGYDVVDDPDFEGNVANDEPFPFQLLGMMCSHHGKTWYEVVCGFRTEDQAKRYVEAIEQADLLKAQIDKSLESTLETIQDPDDDGCTSEELHARKCTNCGRGMSEGFAVSGEDYYCSEECFVSKDKDTWDEYQKDTNVGGRWHNEGGTDEIYWTDWDVSDEDSDSTFYDDDGCEYVLNEETEHYEIQGG